MKTIYIVEDDEDIRELVTYSLRSGGFDVTGFDGGESFFTAIAQQLPSLVLLDIMLEGEDGLTILKRLKGERRSEKLPVIMLTAKSGEYHKVKGLDAGADDYITKPFGVMELISRINAVLRRSGSYAKPGAVVECGGVSLDNSRRAAAVNGQSVTLTFKEYELLSYLMLNAGIVLTRDKLMRTVWDFDFEGESRTLDMHIRSLRRKLGSAGAYIKTVRNVGYMMEG